MITFKSSFVNNVNIQRISSQGIVDYKASIVELDKDSEADYNIMRDIGLSWSKGKSFAGAIFDNFVAEKHNFYGPNSPKSKYFVLSKNPNGLNNSDEALGVLSIMPIDKNRFFIPFMQVKPEHTHNSTVREFISVGEKLLDAVLQKYNNFNFKLYPANEDVEKFFEILNFKKELNKHSMILKR